MKQVHWKLKEYYMCRFLIYIFIAMVPCSKFWRITNSSNFIFLLNLFTIFIIYVCVCKWRCGELYTFVWRLSKFWLRNRLIMWPFKYTVVYVYVVFVVFVVWRYFSHWAPFRIRNIPLVRLELKIYLKEWIYSFTMLVWWIGNLRNRLL